MASITARSLVSFREALVKEAKGKELLQLARGALGRAGRAAKRPLTHQVSGGVAGGAGAGGLAGGVLGAGEGAVKSYQEARERGQGAGEALSAGLSGAASQGARRAAQGALLGGALGGAGGALSKKVPGALAKAPGLGAGARFGQRQLHGLTGWTPKGGIRSIRGGAHAAERGVEESAGALRKAVASGKGVEKAQKGLARAQKGFESAEKAEALGLTSLPGYAAALKKSPGKALKAGFGEQWHGASPGMKALTYGGTGAAVAGEALQGGEEGRLERAGKAVGGALPLLAGPLPIAATMAATPALAAVGGLAGRAAGKLKKKKKEQPNPAPPALDPAGGDTQPSEYVYSDRAEGLGE